MQIRVVDVVGKIAVTAEDGDLLRERVEAVLAHNEPVELDFTGVSIFSSPFFNAAIGRLLEHRSSDELRSVLTEVGLPGDARETMKRVIKNAREYYSDERVRQASAVATC